LLVIDECGHLPSIEKPQTLTELIKQWVGNRQRFVRI